LFDEPWKLLIAKFLKQKPTTYPAFKAFFEKERPDWLRALTPRIINAPSQYWPHKVLALATLNAVLCNQMNRELGENWDLNAVRRRS